MPSLSPQPPPGKAIGIASGTVLAFDSACTVVSGCAWRSAESNADRFAAIAALIDEWQPVRLVVGLPLAPDGSEQPITARCRRFANQLHGRFGLPVALADERFTSAAAEADLRAAGVAWAARKGKVDALAAQLLLQDFLDAAA